MAKVDLDKMTVKELVDLDVRLQKALSSAKDRERSEVRSKIAALAENSGYSVDELFTGARRGRGKSTVAKFVNPDNRNETWTGRGRKPNWLVAKLNKGAKLEDFAA